MTAFKRILWPTDFSESSYQALDAAKTLVSTFSGKLWAVHVVGPIPAIEPSTTFNIPLLERELLQYAQTKLKDVVGRLLERDFPVKQMVLSGFAAEEITRVARQEKIDTIVMATHGRTGFNRMAFGSVAEKLIRTAPCPVLVVRSGKDE